MLLDPNRTHSAKVFLETFDAAARRKGRVIARREQWGPIHLTVDGDRSPLRTEGSFLAVELNCLGTNWSASCACGQPKCEHIYGAFQFLLRNKENPSGGAAPERVSVDKTAPLDQALEHALGRPLKKNEFNLLGTIQRLYLAHRSGSHLTKYDIQSVIPFESLRAPYAVPIPHNQRLNEQEFWHRLVVFTRKYGGKIPELMLPITELAQIEAEEAKERWRESVQAWKNAVATVTISEPPPAQPAEVNLALQFGNNAVRLLVQREPGADFQTIKPKEWEKLLGRVTDGAAAISAEALPILSLFAGINSYHQDTTVSYTDRSARRMIASIIRHPALASRLLTSAGVPYRRAESPLAWSLTQAGESYLLELKAAGRTQSGAFLAVLPGAPTLYLTDDTIFEGPPPLANLGPGPHSIPAPALETREGCQILNALGIPLPPAMEKRTVRLPMRVVLHCWLDTVGFDGPEQLFVRAKAVCDEVSCAQEYFHSHWVETSHAKNKNTDRLYLFDRRLMDAVPRLLDGMKLNWDPNDEVWRTRAGKNLADRFLAWRATHPTGIELKLDGELATLLLDPVKARVQLECQEAGVDWFDLRTTVNVEDTELTREEIQILLNAKGKAVRLEGKGWRRLEYELSEEEDQSLARLGLSPHDLSAEPQRLHALQLADRAAEKLLAAEQYRKIQARAADIKTRVTPDLPATVTATLRPYQTEGYHFLAYLAVNRFGGILADDMGLGKTVQTLTWLAWLRAEATSRKPSLVVCPKSVMENWANEARKFVPDLRIQLWKTDYTGAEGKLTLAEAAEQNDLLVLNYSQLRNLAQDAERIDFRAVILDEAQYIKNPNSQSAQAARALRADHRIALSGTPIENQLLDLWSLMQFAMPGVLGNRASFGRVFDPSKDPLARRRLASRVRPFLLRRTKSQVASDLPDRTEEDLVCELEGKQKTLYSAEFKRAQQMLLRVQTQQELNEFRFHFLTSLLRLRQICCHPALVGDEFKQEESAKLNALIDLLEPLMEEGHKVLVFSQFVEMLQIIRQTVAERQWSHFYLDGSSENRGEIVDAFQKHSGSSVFLISLKAGGFGLNLTAASYVVLYDPWWNPAVENQAIDRTHRIGQTQKVMAYRLLTKNSIEEKIRQLQKQKAGLAQDILGDESFASSLSVDDFRFLFSDPIG